MGSDEKEEGFKEATHTINSMQRMNEFLRHKYHYCADEVGEDEWRTPESFFKTRWSDKSGTWPWKDDVADDCEGTAGFSEYSIMSSNQDSHDSIVLRLLSGRKENVIGCCFNDSTGHAYNQHKNWSVGNWGRIDHGTDDPLTMGKDFIKDANWFSFYVVTDDGSDYEFIEGAEVEFFAAEQGSVTKYIEAVGESKYAVLTRKVLNEVIDKVDSKDMKLEHKDVKDYIPEEKFSTFLKGMNHEIRENTPLKHYMANRLNVVPKKLAPFKLPM
jgi:hypothetical protein